MSSKVVPIRKTKELEWERVSDTLILHRPSGIYYARKSKAGRGRFFKTTGTHKKGLAQTIADQMLSEWMGGKRSAGRRYRIDELCDLLEAVLETEAHTMDDDGNPLRRKRTRDKDRQMLRAADPDRDVEPGTVRAIFGDVWSDEFDEIHWQDWVRGPGRKRGKRLGDIAKYVSKLLTFAHERKIIQRKPVIVDPDPKSEETPTYSIKEIKNFLEHAEPLLWDLIVIAAECGVRPHENCGLQWDWISVTPKKVTVRFPLTFTKTKKAREIILSVSAAHVIRRRLRARGKGPFVFPAPMDPFKPVGDVHRSRMWRRMLKAARAKDGIKFHWLRHTFFSQALLEAAKPLPMVAAYGGNSPKILFDRYMSKQAERTRDVASSVDLGLDGEE